MAAAFVGAPSALASPTGVCVEEPVASEGKESCPAAYHLEAVSTTKARLLNNVTTIECDVSFLGTAPSSESAAFTGNFTYSNCGSCKVTEENGPSTLEVLWQSHEKGAVTGKSLFKVTCGFTVSCSYTASGITGTATGALLAANETGEISLVKQKLVAESGFLCPKEATIDLEMKLSSPTYIASSSEVDMVCQNFLFFNSFLNNPDGKYCTGYDFLPIRNYELAWVFG